MFTFLSTLVIATSYLGTVLTNHNPDKCVQHLSSPQSGFALNSGQIYIFIETYKDACLSVVRIVDRGQNRIEFEVQKGYPKVRKYWFKQDFPNYYNRSQLHSMVPPVSDNPLTVLTFPEQIGLVNPLLHEFIHVLPHNTWVIWYKFLKNGRQTSFKHVENPTKYGPKNAFLKEFEDEMYDKLSNDYKLFSTIRIYNSVSNIGLFNVAYVKVNGKVNKKHCYYYEYDFAADKVKFLRNVTRSLNEYEEGQFLAYDIPERNASFGHRFIDSYSIPTIYYANMTEVSMMDENGRFNKEFVKHITKPEQLFIVSNEIWFGCPSFRHCLHLPIDALCDHLEGQTLIFSGKYINRKGTDCDIGLEIGSAFQNAPNNIVAAFKDTSQNYFIIKDGTMFQYRYFNESFEFIRTYKTGEIFHSLPNVTAALYIKGTNELVYIFTDILNEEESHVWQYEWKNDKGKVKAKFLQAVPISFIHNMMPAVIDAVTIQGKEIIIVKDWFYIGIKNIHSFFNKQITHGRFEGLYESGKLHCSKRRLSFISTMFFKDYLAFQRPIRYNASVTTSSSETPFQTTKYTKPPIFSLLDIIMLLCFPLPILAICCSIYWAFLYGKKE